MRSSKYRATRGVNKFATTLSTRDPRALEIQNSGSLRIDDKLDIHERSYSIGASDAWELILEALRQRAATAKSWAGFLAKPRQPTVGRQYEHSDGECGFLLKREPAKRTFMTMTIQFVVPSDGDAMTYEEKSG